MRAGTRLGPYEIVASIGAGGMGEVYRARDTRLRRNVAIKVLPASFAADEDRLRRFRLEAEAASALNHPNILTVYDVGTDGDSPYLVMELLEGESLRERLNSGKLTTARAIDYARQIAAGLAAAHARGIIHRDLKPENLFVTRDGRVKILDFGVAKLSARAAEAGATMTMATSAGTVVGTAAYMSPEQARGQAVDHRTDIFSFGCVLFEMVTGERAFAGDTQADMVSAILTRDPELGRVPSPGLQRTIAHCLEKDPEQRFHSALDLAFSLEAITQDSGLTATAAAAPAPPRNRAVMALAIALAVLASGCAVLAYLAFRPAPARNFHRLTFRRGQIHAARFMPDGNGVVFSGAWEDEPSDVFTARLDSPGSRPLGFSGAQLRAISPTGELALAQKTRVRSAPFAPAAMLAVAPLSGGAPRPLEDGINFLDWPANGGPPALVRESDQGMQLEYPEGKVLYRTAGYISEPRISPDGQRVAFLDHPLTNDNAGTVAVVDRAGQKRTLTSRYIASQGLAWRPDGSEIWFTATKLGAKSDLHAVTISGRERMVYSAPVSLTLHDISKDGRVLISTDQTRMKLVFRGPVDARERELSWLDWSLISSMSPDGKLIAFFESGEGSGDTPISYLRETSGAPAVALGPGNFPHLSEDGNWVATVNPSGDAVLIYPVGPGQSRRVSIPGFEVSGAGLLADGKTIWFSGNEPGHGSRYYLVSVVGGKPRPATPEGVLGSPPGLVLNGKYLAGRTQDRTMLYPVDGGPAEPLAGVTADERIAGWSADGQAVFVYSRNQLPATVWRVDCKSGRREAMREISPADRAGMDLGLNTVALSRDGKAYAYSFIQILSELQLADGFR